MYPVMVRLVRDAANGYSRDMHTARKSSTTAAKTSTNDGQTRKPGPPDPSDFLGIDTLLSEEELRVRDETGAFVGDRIKSNIREWWERAIFPREIVP